MLWSQLESGVGLDVVIWLQAHGSGLFDALAKGLHYLGGTAVCMALFVLIFWAVDRQLGLRLLLALAIATIVTEILKELFRRPRPHQLYPDLVRALVQQGGYGMPSGHVLIALVVWGYLAVWYRKRWLTVLVAIYVGMVGWARMYAGVHYPQDVVGGLLAGGLLLWLYARDVDRVGSWLSVRRAFVHLALVCGGTALCIVLTGFSENGLSLGGVLLGCGLGLMWEMRAIRLSPEGSMSSRAARIAAGLILTLALYLGLKTLFAWLEPPAVFRVIRYACVGFTVMGLSPWLTVRLGLAESLIPAS